MITFFDERKTYIISFITAMLAHILVFQFGFTFQFTDARMKMKAGFSSLELTLIPSVASRLSCASTQISKIKPVDKKIKKVSTEQKKETKKQEINIQKPKPEKIFSQKNPEPKPIEKNNQKSQPVLKKEVSREIKTIDKSKVAVPIAEKDTQKSGKITKPENKTAKSAINESHKKPLKADSAEPSEINKEPNTKSVSGSVNSINSTKKDGDLRIKGAVTGSELVSPVTPRYPAVCRRRGEQGTVKVKVFINTFGKPINAYVVTSSGYKKLDEEAINSVLNAEFIPARKNGVAVSSDTELNIKFMLEDL